jgi:hypothetical protein
MLTMLSCFANGRNVEWGEKSFKILDMVSKQDKNIFHFLCLNPRIYFNFLRICLILRFV